ncbi:MAG: glycosyltransferase family 4 protein [Candidatus Verstraetearchaeota archaeon]|nr:glycosyltransferase family 4 protein [Candidatus Verstraetearchaeota archaeon]
MKRLKLLAFAPLHGIGGMSVNEGQLINALSKYSDSIYVFSFVSIRQIIFRKVPKLVFPMNKNVKVILSPGLPLQIIFLPIIVFYYGLISLFCLIIQKLLNISIIYIRDRYVGVPMLMLKSFIRKPVVIKFGGFIADELPPNLRNLPLFGNIFLALEMLVDTYLLRQADIILVASLIMRKYVEKRFNVKGKILLCPAGICLEKIGKIAHQENVEGDKVRIGFIGSLSWWQGVDILAEAVAIVGEKLPSVELFIVGDGPMREKVVEICEKYKIKYTITGFVPHEEALKYLRSFNVLVLPSRRTSATESNIPIKVVEAWALGVPVIVTSHKVFQSMCKDGEDVLLVNLDPKDVAEKILLLVSNRELKEKLACNGQVLAQNFDYDEIAKRLLNSIYQKG